MPVGADFGVENKKGSSKNKRGGNLSSLTGDDADQQQNQEGLTMEKLETSNRELARLFVEMFQPLGGTHISAIFNDELLADQARERWSGDLSVECNIQAIDRKGYKTRNKILKTKGMGNGGKKKKKAKGFAAKMAEEMEEDGASSSSSGPFALPTDTEVAIFVAPGPKELIAVERICNEAGMGTCVILLNARLSLVEKYATEEARTLFEDSFETVWSLGAVMPQEDAPGCLMHRAYPGSWALARKPRVGPPKTIAIKEGGRKFSGKECRVAYGGIEVSDLEKGTEKLAENFAGWFK
mmetsp:Transcript_20146/g.36212  ORF Transcript_20146/g.36212 Transcript_20146/m.36212 type:complete len:296 (+) Transcript_20146:317-1204(+)